MKGDCVKLKIKDLKGVAYSSHGNVQFAVLYNLKTQKVIERGSTIDHIIENYGELELTRLQACNDDLVLEVRL